MLCDVCGDKLACSDEGQRAHYLKYHNVVLKREYKPMDAQQKARIVAAFEAKHPGKFFGGEGATTVVQELPKIKRVEVITGHLDLIEKDGGGNEVCDGSTLCLHFPPCLFS
jgi:hypothetical protein